MTHPEMHTEEEKYNSYSKYTGKQSGTKMLTLYMEAL